MFTYIVIGGLGTNRKYYYDFINQLGKKNVRFFELKNGSNHVISLVKYINSIKQPYNIISFSLGCVLVMKTLSLINQKPKGIYFINPSNVVVDLCIHEQPYKWLWLIPDIVKRLYLKYYYHKYVGIKLEEPKELMNHIITKPYTYWKDLIIDIHQNFTWFHATNKIKDGMFKITIISGNNDRYNLFANILNDLYPEVYQLKQFSGQHHLIYTHMNEIVSTIKQKDIYGF